MTTKSAVLWNAEAKKFIKESLRKYRVSAGGWEIEFIDDKTGEIWLLDAPQSHHPGGGPMRLRLISTADDGTGGS